MKSNTGKRLKEIMRERNLKQVDIINLTKKHAMGNVKVSKTDLSQYINEKTEPGQKKLFILAKALDVNEAWLMGYDVPKEKEVVEQPTTIAAHLDGEVSDLDEDEMQKVLEYVKFLKSQQGK
ncbi:helix-turn-helix domain-containing protein [Staphylococcus pseudintermedius]|uniref:helix-turn-helix domain-containing protein n=1 Tax=Staphylococcus pseudintermedius TaxID=283734 RepID=UPI002928FA85|nr:helix-turn-helix domain-containing protein [Staphylococcus pseudintermedius]MDU9297357.1 helix-turn-helix domain-containing protein [Staphylococcus pseudintermedius]MDU9298943.1 helix-turn-helix domain-containing protein [Staphylococcus pseudintermedius]MDU9301618.1 helix-turn-helix domain-containing protein [Staphylococcus pseudintermedius]